MTRVMAGTASKRQLCRADKDTAHAAAKDPDSLYEKDGDKAAASPCLLLVVLQCTRRRKNRRQGRLAVGTAAIFDVLFQHNPSLYAFATPRVCPRPARGPGSLHFEDYGGAGAATENAGRT